MFEALAELVFGVLQWMIEFGPRWMRLGCGWLLGLSIVAIFVFLFWPWK